MSEGTTYQQMTRRELLSGSARLCLAFVVGAGFVASPNATWAVEVTHLQPATMATLIQIARDIYPHDRLSDKYYVAAVKGYDSTDSKEMIEEGITALNSAARKHGHANYLAIGWESDRVAVLKTIEDDAFFQTIRGGLVTGLYNQKPIWPLFGYEGESFSKGGYINHGFNDIEWI